MSESRSCFVAVNPEWRYFVQTVKDLITFDPQPDQRWLAHTESGKDLRILAPAVAVKMLNEALDLGQAVIAVHTETGRTLHFQRPCVAVADTRVSA